MCNSGMHRRQMILVRPRYAAQRPNHLLYWSGPARPEPVKSGNVTGLIMARGRSIAIHYTTNRTNA
jgi:hypothetical protein